MQTGKLQWTVLVILLVACHARADWPEFRGPTRDGAVAGARLPTSWSNTRNIAWRAEIPGEGWSSPVVVGDAIYLTAAIKTEEAAERPAYDLALLILDARTGELRKRVSLFAQGSDSPDIHQKNSHASPTPVVDRSRVYVHFGHQGTACTTLKGEVLWRNDLLGYKPVHGNGGSPMLVDDLLIFSRDGGNISEITALDANTGEIAWKTQRNVETNKRFSFCSPLLIEVDSRRQLILPGTDVVQSIEPRTGKEIWRVTYDGYSVVPRPIYESGLVFVCTGFNQASLLAIDPSGQGDVTETHVRWQVDSNVPKTPSLVGFDGKVVMISDKGIASCHEADSGKQRWRERIGGNFSASPILANQNLYLLSEKGVCTILDISGEPKKIATNELKEDSLASPAVIDDDLLIRTSKALYRISS